MTMRQTSLYIDFLQSFQAGLNPQNVFRRETFGDTAARFFKWQALFMLLNQPTPFLTATFQINLGQPFAP